MTRVHRDFPHQPDGQGHERLCSRAAWLSAVVGAWLCVLLQSHSYWHPNFAAEKRRLSPAAHRAFAFTQLTRSKLVLQERLGVNVDVIAWPFGVYDEELLQIGIDAGYVAGVTLDRRVATASDPMMALPRFLVTDAASGRHFAALLRSESR